MISNVRSGFKVDGDIKDMKLMTNGLIEKLILVAVNNDYMKAFKCR